MKTFPAPMIIEAIVAADAAPDRHPGEIIHKRYSGRSMYGATCDGFTVPDMEAAVRAMFWLGRLLEDNAGNTGLTVEELSEDAEALLRAMRTDSMGRDLIVYFPGWEFTDFE